jgi:ribosome biogenesis GTPase
MNRDSTTRTGIVIASYGQRGLLETERGETERYTLKGRRLRAVCGDRIEWEYTEHGDEAIVTHILTRDNRLERPNTRGEAEILAANLDQLVVVTAPEPATDFFLVDRFICAAELMGIAVALIWNKNDIAGELPAEFADYVGLGYPVQRVSAQNGMGMQALEGLLADSLTMLVGQSGVGKSSLINRLVPDAEVRVNTLSAASLEGRHTTTAAYMHALPGGGRLIDSPGVREFAPVIDSRADIQTGFREIAALAGDCRFGDCRHLREPGCAVKNAVAVAKLSERRYLSYKRLCNMAEALPERWD